MSSLLLGTASAAGAFQIVRPSIEAFLTSHHTDDKHRGLVIAIAGVGESDILATARFGTSEDFPKYEEIAIGKARLAKRLQMSTRRALQEAAPLLQVGDVRYRGGVYEPGVAIGASGLRAYQDEMFAWMTLNAVYGTMDDFIENIPSDAPPFFTR
jgi:hypothetical protein